MQNIKAIGTANKPMIKGMKLLYSLGIRVSIDEPILFMIPLLSNIPIKTPAPINVIYIMIALPLALSITFLRVLDQDSLVARL